MRDAQSPIAFLRSTHAIRERCDAILRAGQAGRLEHFEVNPAAMEKVVARVVRITQRRYPDLRVPWPSRLDRLRLGGHNRLAVMREKLAGNPDELARVLFEVAIISILLGAGAGKSWRFLEKSTGISLGRTEGLALASFHAYASGLFSSRPDEPWRIDADALDELEPSLLARALDVRADNPMQGIEGRIELIGQVGSSMRATAHLFGDAPRLGNLFDAMRKKAPQGAMPARRVLSILLEAFAPVWPSRHTLMGVNLGDVWPHPEAGGTGPSAGLVPFHTFSQWMTYSVIRVLEDAGVHVDAIHELTGLSEYRTCGLFLDDGVLIPKHAGVTRDVHDVGAPVVVEWRALSLALLDELAVGVRPLLFTQAREGDFPARETSEQWNELLPVAAVIEGGTWAAGREAAKERRADGSPPIVTRSEGTVF